ncbi:uncharacterized protein BDW43DRAFT_275179 [Aspergillus alliaceus]|uniref:uncharacterized protein n=1 Tax=Petromyces alliaceus TaxID=209559 RepID=UPI0012A5875B|nr:uncharacterized protein BDW43DRAFT_275179 [Aspergillus alliaceus]KAB8233802.1 hypothetical protein BDW43DRAFT_275179 [Aspergillus alliaceus]
MWTPRTNSVISKRNIASLPLSSAILVHILVDTWPLHIRILAVGTVIAKMTIWRLAMLRNIGRRLAC